MTSRGEASDPTADLLEQWFAVLGPPLAWALHVGVRYSTVPTACAEGGLWTVTLYMMTPLMLIVTALAGWVGWRYWRWTGGVDAMEEGGPTGRTRFMGISGVLLSAMFGLMILAEGIPVFFIGPCY